MMERPTDTYDAPRLNEWRRESVGRLHTIIRTIVMDPNLTPATALALYEGLRLQQDSLDRLIRVSWAGTSGPGSNPHVAALGNAGYDDWKSLIHGLKVLSLIAEPARPQDNNVVPRSKAV